MRTLLRHALTGQYYQSLGKWTADPEKAHDFKFVAKAMNYARKTKCPNMEINLSFDTPQQAASVRLEELLAGL